MVKLLHVMAVLAALALPLASADGDVIDLTPDTFTSTVLDSSDLWLVEFFAPWCGHCKNLAPEWAKAATALKGVVGVGAVDADKYRDLGAKYGVKGFPTIKVFGVDKSKPLDYQGGRTAKDIVDKTMDTLKSIVTDRLGGGGSSSGGGSSGGGSRGSAVVDLSEADFDEQVLGSEDLWLVEFFAPWCGHCKNLAPEWASASTTLQGKAKLGAVDATIHGGLAQRFNVQGYPTIKVFKAGKKGGDGEAEAYEGGRTASSIVEYVEQLLLASRPPPEVMELTSNDVLSEHCTSAQICFISFLPHIIDSGASGRNDYINVQKALADRFRARPFGYVWAPRNAQKQLQDALEVSEFNLPAVVAVNTKRAKFTVHQGAYTEKDVTDFVNRLVAGRVRTQAMREGQQALVAVETAAWDGQDAPPPAPAEDEIDLAELMGVDDDEEEHDEL